MGSASAVFQYLAALTGAFVAALWISLVFWTYRDVRSRTEDRLVHILAALLVGVMGPFGLVIYLLLRPQATIDEVYQRTLEEEALLAEIGDAGHCPGCGRRTETEWIVCPTCHTRLTKPCRRCSRPLELSWQICPYCATPVEEAAP